MFIALSILFFNGCMRFALTLTPSLFPDLTASFFEECDADLAESSIPSNLKILEGLLKSDPHNKAILTALSMGFCGYSMLFVEDESHQRASDLYLRARNYGIHALSLRKGTFEHLDPGDILSVLKDLGKNELEALLWTTISWNAWINLNLDKPAALAQFNISQACLERLLEIDPEYQYGLPYVLKATSISALPPMLGGSPTRAREYFEKALNVSGRKYFLAQYYFAKYYAVKIQDRALFTDLIEEIIQGDSDELKDVCLINAVIQKKVKKLREEIDDLFL